MNFVLWKGERRLSFFFAFIYWQNIKNIKSIETENQISITVSVW